MPSMASTGRFFHRRRDRLDDPLPPPDGSISNGEFVPAAGIACHQAVNETARRTIDESVRRLGVDRRRFLQGAGAVAASLAVFELAGCSAAATSDGLLKRRHGRGSGRHSVRDPTSSCSLKVPPARFRVDRQRATVSTPRSNSKRSSRTASGRSPWGRGCSMARLARTARTSPGSNVRYSQPI